MYENQWRFAADGYEALAGKSLEGSDQGERASHLSQLQRSMPDPSMGSYRQN